MEELTFKIDTFEGPLDLLLKLISKNKLNIYDIPITFIFDQYMKFIDQINSMDMEVAGEFITMASELMLIKSRMLLPKSENQEEEDPREKLAAALIEYRRAKKIAAYLENQFDLYSKRIIKDTDEIKPNTNIIEQQDVKLLEKAMKKLANKAKVINTPPEKSFDPIIKHHIVPISEKIVSVMKYLLKNGKTNFQKLFLRSNSRSEVVAIFMAILELVKSNRVILDEQDDDLILYLNKSES